MICTLLPSLLVQILDKNLHFVASLTRQTFFACLESYLPAGSVREENREQIIEFCNGC